MKDKILNAIDKGLMNALSTDITDQDIDFDKSDITSQTDFSYLFMQYIENKDYVNAYITFIRSDGQLNRYKLKSIKELNQILISLIEANIDEFEYDFDKFQWIDTSDILTFILKSGKEVQIFDPCIQRHMIDKPAFLKIKEKSIIPDMHELIVSVPFKTIKSASIQLHSNLADMQPLCKSSKIEYTGFSNTMDIIKASKSIGAYMNASGKYLYREVMELDNIVLKNGRSFKPYVPAEYEMHAVMNTEGIITWIYACLKNAPVKRVLDKGRWGTSTVNIFNVNDNNTLNYTYAKDRQMQADFTEALLHKMNALILYKEI